MKPAFTEHALYDTMTSNAPVFARPHVKREAGVLKKFSTLGIFFVLKPAILVAGNAVYVWTEGLNGENITPLLEISGYVGKRA